MNKQLEIINAILDMAKEVAMGRYGFGDNIAFSSVEDRVVKLGWEIEKIEGD